MLALDSEELREDLGIPTTAELGAVDGAVERVVYGMVECATRSPNGSAILIATDVMDAHKENGAVRAVWRGLLGARTSEAIGEFVPLDVLHEEAVRLLREDRPKSKPLLWWRHIMVHDRQVQNWTTVFAVWSVSRRWAMVVCFDADEKHAQYPEARLLGFVRRKELRRGLATLMSLNEFVWLPPHAVTAYSEPHQLGRALLECFRRDEIREGVYPSYRCTSLAQSLIALPESVWAAMRTDEPGEAPAEIVHQHQHDDGETQ